MRLTARRRRLAARQIHVADRAAGMMPRRRLDADERRSAAALGLVRAAAKWEPGTAAFETYAIRAAIRQIGRDLRAIDRRPTVSLRRADLLPAREPHHLETPEGREEHAWLVESVARLAPREREAIGLYLSGLRWADVAAAMGIRRSSVEHLRLRAVARLRAMAGAAKPP